MASIPQRTCIGCNKKSEKKDFIRIVKNKQNKINVDITGKAQGRGAYICNNVNCLEKAIKSKKLERAFKMQIKEDVYKNLRDIINRGDMNGEN